MRTYVLERPGDPDGIVARERDTPVRGRSFCKVVVTTS